MMKSMMMKDVTFEEKSSDFPQGLEEGVMKLNEKSEGPEYYYGLRICLNNEVIKKLGLKELPEVGEKLKLNAIVEICCTSENESKEYGVSQSVDLQITEMELLSMKKADPSVKLYNNNNVIESEEE